MCVCEGWQPCAYISLALCLTRSLVSVMKVYCRLPREIEDKGVGREWSLKVASSPREGPPVAAAAAG